MAVRKPAFVKFVLASAPAVALAGLVAACGGSGGGPMTPQATPTPTPPPPNIVVIMADDLEAQGISRMAKLDNLLTRQGTRFANSFATTALCGPSRATFLTGQYTHSHGVLSNGPPHGGFEEWHALGRDPNTIGAWLKARGRTADEGYRGWVLAILIAVGIGLHNFGEGLAVGSAFALGEAALGTLLIIGFTLHNTTEGLAIVSPLARARRKASVGDLAKLGLIGGVPTIAGAWLGGFVYSPVWSVAFLAIGVGAIAQVVSQIGGQMVRERSVAGMLATTPVLAGLFAGFAVMYVTGMLVG